VHVNAPSASLTGTGGQNRRELLNFNSDIAKTRLEYDKILLGFLFFLRRQTFSKKPGFLGEILLYLRGESPRLPTVAGVVLETTAKHRER